MFLVLHALGWSYDIEPVLLNRELSRDQIGAAENLIAARARNRIPAAYLTQKMWFAGHEFFVDERVLVPRSPCAELILDGFQPWLGSRSLSRVLEIGTGSGCIAVAVALAFPQAMVHATDCSAAALDVAAVNVKRHALESRVILHQCDLFPCENPQRYDLIISNPPYVPRARWEELPPEYQAEPESGLVAGDDGLDCVERILERAAGFLQDDGLLVVEVGEIWENIMQRFPFLPFTWVDLAGGGEGVFVLSSQDLKGSWGG